jgi:hypothetical protein
MRLVPPETEIDPSSAEALVAVKPAELPPRIVELRAAATAFEADFAKARGHIV